MPKSKYLISIVGPTGIGKTKLAIEIAKVFETEIISSDSRQFYKELNIGTAVPSTIELEAVKHHFIQHISVKETYNVGDFERDAIEILNKLFKTNDVVVMVGGSGLYEKAITQGLDKFPEVETKIKSNLEHELDKYGLEKLQLELKAKDPNYYAQADIQNTQRVIRALSVIRSSGQAFSNYLSKDKNKREFNSILIGLTASREIIYNRINLRVDQMVENGLLVEAKSVYKYKEQNSLNTVGYKELFEYFEGKIDFDEAVRLIKRNTRRFAKRQLTWYRKDDRVEWFDYQYDKAKILSYIEDKIQGEYKSP
ncbi:tRNA (adenosine(37)-N6)-dimethylallyltransferase MiaA [Psychroflexus sp. ALD_RP9]|uniref:tRNA (adenosine(37)-N6)-dimethylallyltransferase MiaA n=1 Tax=Psychroflexus sp. ALD_RP9 TaxID=2777186 RepID=UPI001A8BFFE0|nr:tRNA (adenosine(37)-N6)-dimethylallyltransferase MiaA [Psychroflexus sp. ALD_RP9]QSS96799.1 tRNA (adenosine(37)-N6)-dimethylallyltransferase MiaA [Psychroflexus sp. ALD_RP9]